MEILKFHTNGNYILLESKQLYFFLLNLAGEDQRQEKADKRKPFRHSIRILYRDFYYYPHHMITFMVSIVVGDQVGNGAGRVGGTGY